MQCPQCQAPLAAGAKRCSSCGQTIRAYGGPPPVGGDATGGLIPYKNAPALTAYYLGLFSILPFLGIPMGIAAVVLGVMGLKKLRAEPRVKGKTHAYVGIGCGGLGALAWIGLLLLIFILPMLNTQ